jgi:hypothetical protein
MPIEEALPASTGFTMIPDDIARFDAILSQGRPFGDSRYILEQMRDAYRRRIEMISVQLPVARQLLDVLKRVDEETHYRVLGDPLVRAVVQQALGQIDGIQMVLSLEECDEILRETVRNLENGATGSPLAWGARERNHLEVGFRTPWIWTTERSDDIFGRSFQKLIAAEYSESLCTPSSDNIAMLQKATRLLHELFPLLARSAFSHAQVLGVFAGTGNWEKVASSSQFRITGAIFLNKTTLKNPWWVAEHLLHESLHQKLYDFRHAHSLLARDDPNAKDLPTDVRMVVSPWNTPGLDAANSWDPHRTMAAFHVYVHLAVFCAVAEQRAPEFESVYGPIDTLPAMTSSRRAFERARYLGENLRSSSWTELGLAGQRMVEWFCSVLDALDPCPAPPGSYLHLILDRYLMEAAKVQQKFPSPGLESHLSRLIQDEIRSTKAVLAAMNTEAESKKFSLSLSNWPNLEQETTFPQVRRLIAETLLSLASNGHTLKPASWTASRSPDEMVRDMVETSSQELAAMGAITTRFPSAVVKPAGTERAA